MKYIVIIALLALTLLSFKNTGTKKDLATVNQVSGLYIFLQSRPVGEYVILGTVKKDGLVWNGRAKEMLNIMTKKALHDYSAAEGIIFDDIQMDHATVIKFK